MRPTVHVLERLDRTRPMEGSSDDAHELRPALEWDDVTRQLRAGSSTCWLSTSSPDGPHVRPVFAAWTGDSFVHASNPDAVKTRYLGDDAPCSVALELDGVHLVVEGTSRRVVGADLDRVRQAFEDVYGWPTTVDGDLLDAPYAAPTSGGPPFEAYEISPVRAYGFATRDQAEPTRWDFDGGGA